MCVSSGIIVWSAGFNGMNPLANVEVLRQPFVRI